jgi:hypothetical protein
MLRPIRPEGHRGGLVGPDARRGQERLKGFKNIQFAEGRLEELPLKAGSVDAAVCLLSCTTSPNPKKAVAEMRACCARAELPCGRHGRAPRTEYKQAMGHQHLGFSPDTIKSMFRGRAQRPSNLGSAARCGREGPWLFSTATGRAAENVKY